MPSMKRRAELRNRSSSPRVDELESSRTMPLYFTRPVRPRLQYAVRIGLWSAVGLGCVGGVVALIRPSAPAAVEAADSPADEQVEALVPGPVAGMGERAVEAWLTATGDDQERLDALFVDPPNVDGTATEGFQVLGVTAVAGRRMAEGYWSVTVAADVVEIVGGEPTGGDAGDADPGSVVDESEPRESTWYVEVGIVGDVHGGLAALAVPSVMPGLPEMSSPWKVVDGTSVSREQEEAVRATVEGFLDALLAGDGNPQRYTAPGVDLVMASPAPFETMSVEEVTVAEVPDHDGRIWVQAQVLATTPGDTQRRVSYDLLLDPRTDRWEVVSLSGAPTFVVPSDPDSEEQE